MQITLRQEAVLASSCQKVFIGHQRASGGDKETEEVIGWGLEWHSFFLVWIFCGCQEKRGLASCYAPSLGS